MRFIKYSKNKDALKILTNDERCRNMDTLAAMLVKVMTNMNLKFDKAKEKTDMCQALRDIIEENRLEDQKIIEKANKTIIKLEKEKEQQKLRFEKENEQQKLSFEQEIQKKDAEIINLMDRIAKLEAEKTSK